MLGKFDQNLKGWNIIKISQLINCRKLKENLKESSESYLTKIFKNV